MLWTDWKSEGNQYFLNLSDKYAYGINFQVVI